jgi:hypothetical protein
MDIQIRYAELEDYNALHAIYTGSKVVWGTLQPLADASLA